VLVVESERERLLRDEEMRASARRALHEFMPRRPMLFATTSTIDVSLDALAEAGIAEACADSSLVPRLLRRWRAACGRQEYYERNAIPQRWNSSVT
jgi:hypothetical protein